jgi:hypothetical protein
MKRTTLMIVAGTLAALTFGALAPASADLFDGMPMMGTMDIYNQIMGQYYASPQMPTSLMGMPTTTIMDDYYTLLPQLQALQAWAHANGMPYALPGTLGGYDAINGVVQNRLDAMEGWGNRFDRELLRGEEPIFTWQGGRHALYPSDF